MASHAEDSPRYAPLLFRNVVIVSRAKSARKIHASHSRYPRKHRYHSEGFVYLVSPRCLRIHRRFDGSPRTQDVESFPLAANERCRRNGETRSTRAPARSPRGLSRFQLDWASQSASWMFTSKPSSGDTPPRARPPPLLMIHATWRYDNEWIRSVPRRRSRLEPGWRPACLLRVYLTTGFAHWSMVFCTAKPGDERKTFSLKIGASEAVQISL